MLFVVASFLPSLALGKSFRHTHHDWAAMSAAELSMLGWPVPTAPTVQRPAGSCDLSTCASGTAAKEVGKLREQAWPAKDKGPSPNIAHAVYINLDWDTKRRDFMDRQLAAVAARARSNGTNFTYERLSAVLAGKVQHNASFHTFRMRGFSDNKYPSMHGDWRTAAVQYSHESIIERVQQQKKELLAKNEVWLILEDDSNVPADLNEKMAELWPFVPKDWDILRLGWFGYKRPCQACVNAKFHVALWADPPPHGPCDYCGTQGYIVNPASAEKVMRRLRDSKLYYIDALLGAGTPPGEDKAKVPDLAVFVPIPAVITQEESFDSDRAS